jgi:hypothetical protein
MFGVGKLHEQAKMGEYILTYLDNSDPALEKRLSFVASNSVSDFSSSLDVWDKEFPLYRIKWRYSSERARIDEFLLKRGMSAVTNNASTSVK